ncbi:MAG: NAD-dependent epimerase/dehydratase family protein, partial [Marinirhabdus sp.]
MFNTPYHSKDLSDHAFLITGGAGFIGSNIAKKLCELGHDVVIADTLGNDNIKWKNISRLPLER